MSVDLPLKGVLVLEFCQYMAGPSAGLRLADLGARVIKIERPGKGEGCRQLAIRNIFVDDDSLVFHTVNRNKESYAANLKDPADLAKVKQLIARADIMTHNFRPGVMEKIGLDYESVKTINPRLIYGEITGYGRTGPWKDKPGQDLLVQSISGLTWLSGNRDKGPVPMGLAVVDILCGNHLNHGLLAALIRRGKTGQGARVEVSLLASAIDFQFEVLTTHLNDGGKLPQRSAIANAHAYLAAPYGIHKTRDGYIALAMTPLPKLADAMDCPELHQYDDPKSWFDERDRIKEIIAKHLAPQDTAYWLSRLEPAGIWCSDVYDYPTFFESEGYKVLKMEQRVDRGGNRITTTRCPIRLDGQRLFSDRPAPRVGEHNTQIEEEFNLSGDTCQTS